jgi:TonB family protein
MFAPSSDRVSRRLLVGIGASLLLHALLVVLVVVATKRFNELPKVKRGEPLFVELPNINEPAPRGNPAARELGPPPPAAAPSRPVAPAPVPRPPASAPPVAKAPSVAPPAPVPPAPRAPVPSPPTPAPTVAEKPAPPAPDRIAAAPPADPAPSRPSQNEEPVRPAEPPKTAKEPSPPANGASAQGQEVRTPPGDARTAMVPPSAGSTGSPGVPDMRSALRRGGGAGGTSDGRGGIEGEPIPLDSRDPRYSDYLDRIRRMIKEKWGYPCVKNGSTHECEYKTALLVIEFGIARDGKVPFVNVVRTSGFQIYDDYAVNAIKFAQPFPRVPDSMGSRTGVPIVATFSYQVDTSLVNLLR